MATESATPADIYEGLLSAARAVYATSAVVVYDYIITYQYEVEFVWKRKWNATTWVFLLNRYSMIATAIYQASPATPWVSTASAFCSNVAVGFFKVFTNGFQALISYGFDVLRVFALLSHDRGRNVTSGLLFLLLLMIWTAQAYTSVEVNVTLVKDPVLGNVCADSSTAPSNVGWPLYLASLIGNAVSQLIVLVVTWIKTFSQVRQASLLGMRTPLSRTLLRDGSLFFLFMFIAYSFNVILIFNDPLTNSVASWVIPAITNVLPYLLLSRFLINLRQLSVPQDTAQEDGPRSSLSFVNFRIPTIKSIIGNIGEPLEFVNEATALEDNVDQNRGEEESFNINRVDEEWDGPIPDDIPEANSSRGPISGSGFDVQEIPI